MNYEPDNMAICAMICFTKICDIIKGKIHQGNSGDNWNWVDARVSQFMDESISAYVEIIVCRMFGD